MSAGVVRRIVTRRVVIRRVGAGFGMSVGRIQYMLGTQAVSAASARGG